MTTKTEWLLFEIEHHFENTLMLEHPSEFEAKRAAVRSIREDFNDGIDVVMEIFVLGQQIGEAFAPRKLGQKGGRPKDITDEQVIQAVGEWDRDHDNRRGMQKVIALDLGVDPSTISKALSRLNDPSST